MESEGSLMDYTLFHDRSDSQPEQLLTADPENQDIPPPGLEWNIKCQSMPDLSQSNSASEGQHVCHSNAGPSSHAVLSENGDSNILSCHSDTANNSTPNHSGHAVANSTICNSANDAAMSCIADSDIDFNSILYDSDFDIVCVQEDIPYQQTVHGQDGTNQQVVYIHTDDITGQVVYIQNGACNEQVPQGPDAWLNGADLFQQQPMDEDDVDLGRVSRDLDSVWSEYDDSSDFELSSEVKALFANEA